MRKIPPNRVLPSAVISIFDMLQMDLKVLLADDNAVNQKVLQKMLKKIGYHSDIASNGLEAIKSFEHKHHDVILMDIQMPEMDGLEATRAIRERWPDRDPKIIAVTAYANCFDRDLCFEAGMDEYLTKPLILEELQSAMSKVANEGILDLEDIISAPVPPVRPVTYRTPAESMPAYVQRFTHPLNSSRVGLTCSQKYIIMGVTMAQ